MLKKHKRIIVGLLAVLMLIFGVVWAKNNHNPSGSNTIKNGNSASERKKNHMALISIDDKAGLADTNYRVNGLHVYDYTTVDKEDYVDGAEVPLGTNLSVFVYNLASEVHLKVTHNGKVIVDKDYPILKSDKDVEKIKFKVEGDVKVETWVINSKAKDHIATVRINNDQLATAYIGEKELKTFSDVKFGTHDLTVRAKHNGVKAILKINDRLIGTADVLGGQSYTFKNVKVDGDIYFIYRPLNKKEVESLGGTYKKDDIINRVRNGQVVTGQTGVPSDPTVTIINKVRDSRVTLDIRHVDTNHNIFDIVSGNHYPKGMFVFSRVINRSDLKLRLTATSNGRVIDSVIIKPKPENDDATYFGIREIVLSDNLTYVLEVVGQSNGTHKPDPKPKPNPKPDPKPNPNPDPKPPVPQETYTLTINDGAAKANKPTIFNTLHVYNPVCNPVTDDYDEYENNTKLKKGDKVVIYSYNNVTDIHLKIKHKGKVIVDTDIDRIEQFVDDHKLIYYRLNVEGDIEITTSVGKTGKKFVDFNYPVTVENKELAKIYDGNKPIGNQLSAELHNLKVESLDDPIQVVIKAGKATVAKKTLDANSSFVFENVPVKNDMHISLTKLPKPTKQYKVEVVNPYQDVVANVSNVGDKGVKPIVSGEKYDENTKVFTQITNKSQNELIVTATRDGKVVETKTLPVSDQPNGIDPIDITGNIKIEIKKKPSLPQVKQYKVEIVNPDNDVLLKVTNTLENKNPVEVQSGKSYQENSIIHTKVINKATDEITISVMKKDGTVIESKTLGKAMDNDGTAGVLKDIVLKENIKIEVKKKEPAVKKYAVYINNKLSNDKQITADIRYTVGHNPIDIISGQKFDEGQQIWSRIINRSNKRLRLTAKNSKGVLASVIIEPKPENDDATYFGIWPAIKLLYDVEFVLEEVK